MQNPRRNAPLIATPCGVAVLGQLSLLRGLATLVWAKPDLLYTRTSKTILHDALNGRSTSSNRACYMPKGGWVTNYYTCALFIGERERANLVVSSLDPRPSASLPYTLAHEHYKVTFEPCAVVRRQKAWKIFIT